MRNTICATLTAITLALCIALAGCGTSNPSTPAHAIAATGTTCSAASRDGVRECIVTLSETRRVDCIVTTGSHGASGISCDWDHVSGADKEPQ